MDKLVKQIQATNVKDVKELRELQELLKKNDATIGKSAGELDRAIQQLDAKVHTLGLIHFLSARAGMAFDDVNEFVASVQRLFLQGSVEQGRMEPKRCVRIAHKVVQLATEYQMPMRVITCLEKGIVMVQETEGQLTGIHADLLQVCLLSKCYHRAEALLAHPVLNIGEAKTNGFTQSDYLRYWYYAGLVFTGVKRFADAIDAFEQCFAAPAQALSAPAVEAYKKFVLVSLIQRGSTDTKRSGNPMMMRNLKTACQRYVDFATAFATKDSTALNKAAADNHEAFVKDGNFGLVQQCIESLADRQIRALTQTYLTLNSETLAKGASVKSKDEALRRVVAMVDAGTIVATVNEKEGMVSFGELSEQFDDVRTLNHIDGQIRNAIHWGSLMRHMDDQIASSAEFLQKTSGLMEGRGAGGGGAGGMGFDPEMYGMMQGGGFGGAFGDNMG